MIHSAAFAHHDSCTRIAYDTLVITCKSILGSYLAGRNQWCWAKSIDITNQLKVLEWQLLTLMQPWTYKEWQQSFVTLYLKCRHRPFVQLRTWSYRRSSDVAGQRDWWNRPLGTAMTMLHSFYTAKIMARSCVGVHPMSDTPRWWVLAGT